jgi:hypothetical protein
MSYVCESFCDRMKPCNNNSQCIYSSVNNTFTCRCLNGASNCDSSINENNNNIVYSVTSTMSSIDSSTILTEQTTAFLPKFISNDAKVPQIDTKSQSGDIPKFGINYENVGL